MHFSTASMIGGRRLTVDLINFSYLKINIKVFRLIGKSLCESNQLDAYKFNKIKICVSRVQFHLGQKNSRKLTIFFNIFFDFSVVFPHKIMKTPIKSEAKTRQFQNFCMQAKAQKCTFSV